MLVALLLPAVQSARESAGTTQCKNNLRQLGLVFLNSHDTAGHFPTTPSISKAGISIVIANLGRLRDTVSVNRQGLPEQLTRISWTIQVLPYLEETGNYDMIREAELNAFVNAIATPMEVFNCPSRREATVYSTEGTLVARLIDAAPRTDYAACGGDTDPPLPNIATVLSLAPRPKTNGIVAQWTSKVRIAQVTDGLSKTYMLGEKYLPREHYTTGQAEGDSLPLLLSEWSTGVRIGNEKVLPFRDDFEQNTPRSFGSAHSNGFQTVFGDGSVRLIPYDIYGEVHRRLCNRSDELPVDFNF